MVVVMRFDVFLKINSNTLIDGPLSPVPSTVKPHQNATSTRPDAPTLQMPPTHSLSQSEGHTEPGAWSDHAVNFPRIHALQRFLETKKTNHGVAGVAPYRKTLI